MPSTIDKTDGGGHQVPPRHLLADLEIADAARKHERDDRLAHGVQIREREQTAATAIDADVAAWRSSPTRSAPQRAGAKRLVPQIVGVDRRPTRGRRATGARRPPNATTSHRRIVMSHADALLAQPSFHLAADRRQALARSPPRSARRCTGCVFDARISPQPSPNRTRTPSTSMTSCLARKCFDRAIDEAELELLRHLDANLGRRDELRDVGQQSARRSAPSRRGCAAAAPRRTARRRGRRTLR